MTYPPTNDEFLTKENFNCTSCGQCCRPIVLVSEEEIKRIELLGLKRKNFINIDPIDGSGTKSSLKQTNGVCIFLKRKDDRFLCSIYEERPNICRKYPFFDDEKLTDCRPKRWKFWMDLKELVK